VEASDPRSYYKVAERIRDEQGAFLPTSTTTRRTRRRTTAPPGRRSGSRRKGRSRTGSAGWDRAARSAASPATSRSRTPRCG
jgi:hypothetical protein